MAALRNAIFLHTQKTAGSSIVKMARAQYGDSNIISHGDWLAKNEKDIEQKPFVSGHFGFAFADRLLGDRYSFTFLREPVDRIVSLYSFCRSQPAEEYAVYGAASRLSLDQFVALGSKFSEENIEQFQCHSMIWNNQAWQLAHGWDYNPAKAGKPPTILDYSEDDILKKAKCNLEKFDYVGFTDTFAKDANEIHRHLGFGSLRRVPHENSSRRRHIWMLKPVTRAAINAVTQVDQEIYAIAQELVRRRTRRFWNLRFGT